MNRLSLEPQADQRYLLFVDQATGSGQDGMTMGIAHLEEVNVVGVLSRGRRV